MEIDFSGLERELTARLGVKDLHITGQAFEESDRRGKYIEFESNELKNQAGILYSIYDSLKINNFSNGWIPEKECYWMAVHFSYQYKKGGYNGTTIMYAHYFPKTKEWTFQEA